VFISLSRAASIGGLIYFLFAEVEILNTWLISTVTGQGIWLIGKFDFPVTNVAWNQLAVNGLDVEIILACTAIESIALFSGIISSATGATVARKLQAFMISVPVIYLLNIIRVSFTASAYGLSWFGTPDESFHISEHFITKAGSLLALFIISYMVMKTLPEVTDMIDGVLKMMRIEFRRLMVR
jgi:archaeosortase A (PGF-CTERM-specific)